MVKEKPNSTRTYDADGYRKRAACLCVRSEDETEVLLVTSSRTPDRWIVPGGGLEPDEEPSMAAIREVWEEAGVRGKLGRCLGIFENQERKHRTAVFVLVVTEELDEWEDSKNIGRKRQWFKLEEALNHLEMYKPVQWSYLKLLDKNDKVHTSSKNKSTPEFQYSCVQGAVQLKETGFIDCLFRGSCSSMEEPSCSSSLSAISTSTEEVEDTSQQPNGKVGASA